VPRKLGLLAGLHETVHLIANNQAQVQVRVLIFLVEEVVEVAVEHISRKRKGRKEYPSAVQ